MFFDQARAHRVREALDIVDVRLAIQRDGDVVTPSFLGTSTRSSHAGNPFETSFWKKPGSPMPR